MVGLGKRTVSLSAMGEIELGLLEGLWLWWYLNGCDRAKESEQVAAHSEDS